MNPTTKWLKQGLARVVFLLLACLLLIFGSVGQDHAFARPLSSPAATVKTSTDSLLPNLPTEQPLQQLGNQAGSALQQFVQQTQTSFDQSLRDTQTALNDLPQNLERFANGTISQIQQDLEARKDLLDNAADSIDNLGKKIKKFGGDLSQANAKSMQKIFDDAADAIEVLTDDIEDAENSNSAELRTQIDQHIQSANQALDRAQQSLKTLSKNLA